jgi:hypothetical protein
MGPEFDFEIVGATEDRCMGRASKCPCMRGGRSLALKRIFAIQATKDGGIGLLKV